MQDLLEALRADYVLRGKASGQALSHLKRADADFGEYRATALTSEKIDAYVEERLAHGDAPASINRPLQLIRQGYKLALTRNHLTRAPFIRRLSERGNERKGFFTEQEIRTVISHLPDYLKDFTLFAFCTGMRLGEIKSLAWANVRGDVLELEAKDAKNGEARLIPMVGRDLSGILARRKAARQVRAGDSTTLAALIFHHNGKPIVDIRKAWKSACRKAGVAGRLFHDLRRSACRFMDMAGVSRDVAMKISGHKTQSMYSRYNIVAEDNLRRALERTQVFREATTGGNVVSFSK